MKLQVRKSLPVLLTILLMTAGCSRSLVQPDQDSNTSDPTQIFTTEETEMSSMEANSSPERSKEAHETNSTLILPSANTENTSTSLPEQSSSSAVREKGKDQEENQAPLTQTITIPEGYTLARIAMMLEEKGICPAEKFIAASQTGDFSEFSLLVQQNDTPNRCFRLEGYLYPDTYEIYTADPPDSILRRILTHMETKLDASLRRQIQESGFSADEILTLASIIEKEAYGYEQMPYISSVLHNRLEQGMKLQCDVTITYVEGAIKPFITGDKNRYNSAYNTYKCEALPAGAICNPGLDAIKAALFPQKTDYLYFVTDTNRNYYYASTWEEHLDNLNKVGKTEEQP